jgi:hypothetical protein
MMSSILRLRVINLIGALLFTAYGLAIRAYPVAVTNFVIVLIDVYFLVEILRAKEYFTLLEVPPESEYLLAFLRFYEADIHRFLPDFRYQPAQDQVAFFVLRNMIPAGLFIGRRDHPGRLVAALDFVIPGYRDFRTGRYVFGEQAAFFHRRGIHSVCSPPGSPAHQTYLRRMGFVQQPGDGDFVLEIGAGTPS